MAIERALTKKNDLKIVGTLTDVETRTGTTKAGADYISGKVTVKVKDAAYDVHYFSQRLTKLGQPNKLYNTYASLDSFKNKRVEINGSLDESVIVEGQTVRRGNTLNLKFISVAKEAVEDSASYIVEGFINKQLAPVYDKDGSTIRDYALVIGQADYSNKIAKYLTLHVDPSNVKAVDKISRDYTTGKTVHFEGALDFTVVTEQKVTENDFGPDTVKTIQKSSRRYPIVSGNIIEDEALAYTSEEISILTEGTREADALRVSGGTKATTPTQTSTSVKAKLI